MKLLLVENHPEFARAVVGQFLAQHQVTVVPSLAEARQALARETFEAVLVDHDLDDGKGLELVRELVRGRFSGRIVAISAKDEANAAMRAAGAHAACGKLKFRHIGEALGLSPGVGG